MFVHGTTAKRAGLAGVLRRQLQALLQHLPHARRGRVRAVHQARVASRRLREALPIASRTAPSARRLKLGRAARRITNALGPVREIDVTLQEFEADTRGAGAGSPPTAVQQVRRHLTAERDRRARGMRLKLDRLDLKQLRTQVEGLAQECEAAIPRAWRPALAARMRKRGKRFGEAVRAAGTLYAADPLHRVRIAGKRLRYTLELARAAAGAPVRKEIASLKRLQDLLGRLRDVQVLGDHVRLVMTDAAESVQLKAALDKLQADLEAECRTLHARFLERVDDWLALADRAARQIPAAVAVHRAAQVASMRLGGARRARRASGA